MGELEVPEKIKEVVERSLAEVNEMLQDGRYPEVHLYFKMLGTEAGAYIARAFYHQGQYEEALKAAASAGDHKGALQTELNIRQYVAKYYDAQKIEELIEKIGKSISSLNSEIFGTRNSEANFSREELDEIRRRAEAELSNLNPEEATYIAGHVMHNLARFYMDEYGELENAEEMMNKALICYGDDTHFNHRAAANFWKRAILLEQGKIDEAILSSKESEKLWTKQVEITRQSVERAREQQEGQERLEKLEKDLERFENNYENAIKEVKALNEMKDELPSLKANGGSQAVKARISYHLRKYSRALEEVNRAEQTDKVLKLKFDIYKFGLKDEEKTREALDALKSSVTTLKEEAENLSKSKRTADEILKIGIDLTNNLTKDSINIETTELMVALAYLASDNPEEIINAEKLINKAIEFYPEDEHLDRKAGAYYAKAKILRKLKNYDEAIEAAESSIALWDKIINTSEHDDLHYSLKGFVQQELKELKSLKE